MNRLNKAIAAFLICAAAFSMTGCNNDKNSSSTTVITDSKAADTTESSSNKDQNSSEDEDTTSIPDADDDGNKITVLEVTDDAGKNVTDAQGVAVTELAIVDKSNAIVTDAEGSAVTPNISKKPAKDTAANDNNASTTKNNSSGNIVANAQSKGLLWIADYSQGNAAVTNSKGEKRIFDALQDDGELFKFELKIKDDAKAGNYELSFNNKNSTTDQGSFCDLDGNDIPSIKLNSATVAVGSDTVPEAASISGMTISLSNACAKPGDTITIYGTISNNTGLTAFNTYIMYDSNVFTVDSISAGKLISGKGEFMS